MSSTPDQTPPDAPTLDDAADAPAPSSPADHAQRDGEALVIMGVFLAVLGVAVLIGTLWNEPGKGMVVNVVAGLVLLVVAAGAGWMGLHSRRRIEP